MVIRKHFVYVAGCVVVLLMAGIVSLAQAPSRPLPPVVAQGVGPVDLTHLPEVISGNDFGLRVETTRDGIVVGKLVVRVNGRWIDAQLGGAGVVPVESR